MAEAKQRMVQPSENDMLDDIEAASRRMFEHVSIRAGQMSYRTIPSLLRKAFW